MSYRRPSLLSVFRPRRPLIQINACMCSAMKVLQVPLRNKWRAISSPRVDMVLGFLLGIVGLDSGVKCGGGGGDRRGVREVDRR